MMRSNASQKLGIHAPAIDSMRISWSLGRLRRIDASTPAGMAISMASSMAGNASSNVRGMRRNSSWRTGAWVVYDRPRSPRAARAAQCR